MKIDQDILGECLHEIQWEYDAVKHQLEIEKALAKAILLTRADMREKLEDRINTQEKHIAQSFPELKTGAKALAQALRKDLKVF